MYVTIGPADVIDVVITGTGINVSYYSTYLTSTGFAINNATVLAAGTYTLVPTPSPTTTNQSFGMSMFNNSTSNSVTVVVRYNNGPPQEALYTAILPPGFALIYEGGQKGGNDGWEIYDTSGTRQ